MADGGRIVREERQVGRSGARWPAMVLVAAIVAGSTLAVGAASAPPVAAAGCAPVGYPSTGSLDPHAIDVGPDGAVWLAETFLRPVSTAEGAGGPATETELRISRLDPSTGALTVVHETPAGGAGERETPLLAVAGGAYFNRMYLQDPPGSFPPDIDLGLSHVTAGGTVTDTPNTIAVAPVEGSDGRIWGLLSTSVQNSIAALDPDTQIVTPYLFAQQPNGLRPGVRNAALGQDGNVWVTSENLIGRVTPTGQSQFFTSAGIVASRAITAGPDAAVWFSQIGTVGPDTRTLGRVGPAGGVSLYRPGNAPPAAGLEYDLDAGIASTETGLWSGERVPVSPGSIGPDYVYEMDPADPNADLVRWCFLPTTFDLLRISSGPSGVFVTGNNGSGNSSVYRIDPVLPPPTCNGRTVTVDLNTGGTTTAGNDVILGTPGDDTISALGGNDVVCGGDGADTIAGGSGADVLLGQAGTDDLTGNGGADSVVGGLEGDVLRGSAGADLLQGKVGDDDLRGGEGTDTLRGGTDDDDLDGGTQRDSCDGGSGAADAAVNCESTTSVP